MIIEGTGIVLCPFDRRHLDKTRQWANDSDLSIPLDRARPISDIEHHDWFESLHKDKQAVYFALETADTRDHIGMIWLWGIDWRHRKAELSIYIGEQAEHGKGYASEAIALLCEYGFQKLNLHKIYAYVLGFNLGAKRAFEKAGFVLEGTLKNDRWAGKEYVDVFLLGAFAKDGD